MVSILSRNTIRFSFDDDTNAVLAALANLSAGVRFIVVEHGRFRAAQKNAVQIAYLRTSLRPVIDRLAVLGFVMYAADGDSTRFVHQHKIGVFWHRIKSGEYLLSSGGLVYTLDQSGDASVSPSSLIVVFSSMASPFDKASLTRFFEQNFHSLRRHVPDSTAILRIADIDGVVGGFYLPTVFDPERPRSVSTLIDSVCSGLGISRDRCVLYGASKGGTGALYLGLEFGWNTVAVDPVVDDAPYERRYNDTHWTSGGIFLGRKTEQFHAAALHANDIQDSTPWRMISVVTAQSSPLFESISRLEDIIDDSYLVSLLCQDDRIKDHPDVSIRTLRTVTGLLNMAVQGLSGPSGTFEISGCVPRLSLLTSCGFLFPSSVLVG